MSGVASTPDEVATYAGCTLLAAECATTPDDGEDDTADQQSTVTAAIRFLTDSEFITLRTVKDTGRLSFTQIHLGPQTYDRSVHLPFAA